MKQLLTTLLIALSATVGLAETTSSEQNGDIVYAADSKKTNSYCVAVEDYLQKRLDACKKISGEISGMDRLLAVKAARQAVWKLRGAKYLIDVASSEDAKAMNAACDAVSEKDLEKAMACTVEIEAQLAIKFSPGKSNPPLTSFLKATSRQELDINMLTYFEAFDTGSELMQKNIRKLESRLGMY